MKKVLVLLFCMIFGSVAFSATMASDTLGIYLYVTPIHEIKVLSVVPESVVDFNDAFTIGTHTFTESPPSVGTYFMVIKTNNKQAVHIDVFFENMKSSRITTQIGYTVSTGTKTVTSTSLGKTRTLFTEAIGFGSTGMRIVSEKFTITLSSIDVANATAANYVANIVFSLVSP